MITPMDIHNKTFPRTAGYSQEDASISPAAPAPGSPANAGSQAPVPAHTGFTQRLDRPRRSPPTAATPRI